MRVIARPRPNAIASWTMTIGRNRPATVDSCDTDICEMSHPTAVVASNPRNIHRNAWLRKAVESATAGRTPSCEGVYPDWFMRAPLLGDGNDASGS